MANLFLLTYTDKLIEVNSYEYNNIKTDSFIIESEFLKLIDDRQIDKKDIALINNENQILKLSNSAIINKYLNNGYKLLNNDINHKQNWVKVYFDNDDIGIFRIICKCEKTMNYNGYNGVNTIYSYTHYPSNKNAITDLHSRNYSFDRDSSNSIESSNYQDSLFFNGPYDIDIDSRSSSNSDILPDSWNRAVQTERAVEYIQKINKVRDSYSELENLIKKYKPSLDQKNNNFILNYEDSLSK